MDLEKREDRYYVRIAGRIEKELGVRYDGNSMNDLKAFVEAHKKELNISRPYTRRWKDEKKKKKKKVATRRTPAKPATIKQAGMFRKHGSGQNFQSENT